MNFTSSKIVIKTKMNFTSSKIVIKTKMNFTSSKIVHVIIALIFSSLIFTRSSLESCDSSSSLSFLLEIFASSDRD